MNSSYLMHHGIKGMHWGIRRARDDYNDISKYDTKTQKKIQKQNDIIANTHRKKKMQKAVRRAITARKIGDAKQFAKKAKNAAAIAGLAALTGYAISQNKNNFGSSLSDNVKTVAKTMGKTAVSGAKKAITSETVKKAYNTASRGISTAVKTGSKAIKRGVANSVKKQLGKDIDGDDPRTWVNTFRNAKDVINTGKRIYNNMNNLKNKNFVAATIDLAPDIIEKTNDFLKKHGINVGGNND